MNVAEKERHSPSPVRRHAYPKSPRRKTPVFTVRSPEHLRIVREALEAFDQVTPLKWKRMRISRLLRNINAALEVAGA